jgi:hypothetical protein
MAIAAGDDAIGVACCDSRSVIVDRGGPRGDRLCDPALPSSARLRRCR